MRLRSSAATPTATVCAGTSARATISGSTCVRRFSASPVARAALAPYRTSGNLSIPLVSLHTTLDPVIPFWHELLYFFKVDPVGRGRFLPLPVQRYGHCNFTTQEVVAAFGLAVAQP
jgi:hypothetical protein